MDASLAYVVPSPVDAGVWTGYPATTTICSHMTTNRSQKGIGVLFASTTLVELLRLFMLQPEREYYQRELQRLTGAHLRQLQRDLVRLEQSGLVEQRVHGNRRYYKVVIAHPAYADLRAVIMKTVGLGDQLRGAMASLGQAVTAAFVYGSVARGDEVAESDVDLFVIGDASRRDVAVVLAPVAEAVGRELNPIIVSPADFAARLRDGDHLITSVLENARIWLVGDEAWLAALA
jgi:predicted nucleotidyltransferase